MWTNFSSHCKVGLLILIFREKIAINPFIAKRSQLAVAHLLNIFLTP